MNSSHSTEIERIQRDEVVQVQRSAVPAGLRYGEYREYLRRDFFHACAYCTLTEAEGGGVRFTIDHYEPQSTNPKLVDDYENLMWACDKCNQLKSDLDPPDMARQDGHRFFRPDTDKFFEHFKIVQQLLEEVSKIGWFTIEFLDLNRLSLRRIRSIRERLGFCEKQVAAGLAVLRNFGLDRLPPNLRDKAQKAVASLEAENATAMAMIEAVLRENAKSELIDEDPEATSRSKSRSKKLREIGALYPGQDWRRSGGRDGQKGTKV